MMTKIQKNSKAIKRTNKGKKLWRLVPHCLKLLKNGLAWNGVETVHNVYLEYHLIKMGIQSDMNTKDHGLITSYNFQPKLIWW
jgi:hypothetical protein